MSTKQCEEKLKDKGVRPTAARILILQKLSEQTYPISLLELEAQLETLDKSTISRSLAILLEHHAIHAFEDGSGSMKYEICRSDTETCFIENRHIHFYCEVCHKTYCMDHIKIPGRAVARRLHHRYDQLHGQRNLPGMQVPKSVKRNRVAKISSVLCIGIIKTD